MSFLLGGISVCHSMVGTMMVAGEAHGAMAIPMRNTINETDVVQRTDLGADAAAYTVFFYTECLAAHKEFSE